MQKKLINGLTKNIKHYTFHGKDLPQKGDLVFFYGIEHVALATGEVQKLKRKFWPLPMETKVLSFWPRPMIVLSKSVWEVIGGRAGIKYAEAATM